MGGTDKSHHFTESDVEQKFIFKFLTAPKPTGLGFFTDDIRTKVDIRSIKIDKGKKQKLYYPDYVVLIEGIPSIVVEAKAPQERNLDDALREARLYCNEINASYPNNINPCTKIIVTNGIDFMAGYWDVDEPHIHATLNEMNIVGEDYIQALDFLGRESTLPEVRELRKSITKDAKFVKPVTILGGRAVQNETYAGNSFGANIALEYKTIFNPNNFEEKEEVVKNAYVTTKKKQRHLLPIDKIIRSSMSVSNMEATSISDTKKPIEFISLIENGKSLQNEICLLIGSVGSGKSTFTSYLEVLGLPTEIKNTTKWLHLDMNKAPVSSDKIYDWVTERLISRIKAENKKVDFDDLETLEKLFKVEMDAAKKGPAKYYSLNSEKYADIMYETLIKLQNDSRLFLQRIMERIISTEGKLPIVALDNCDKRSKDHQLLMFEVATWMKDTFPCMIFLPLRDTTYDQYRNHPPLDTVIKDQVFRIDPPLLEKVLYARLNYILRKTAGNSNFTYTTNNGTRIVCKKEETINYMRCILNTLFENTNLRTLIKGIAGRNIRKGLEIIIDFCKSGYISSDDIVKMRMSNGDFQLPYHIAYNVLFKGNRKYYSDESSMFKNLFSSEPKDDFPDPFIRIRILKWLENRYRIKGPNNTSGFFKLGSLLSDMQASGHSRLRANTEVLELYKSDCITSEALNDSLTEEDLISITSAGFTHLELLNNISYLSSLSEDTNFLDPQVATRISDNLVGKSNFRAGSREASLDNSLAMLKYLAFYYENKFPCPANAPHHNPESDTFNIGDLAQWLEDKSKLDINYTSSQRINIDYPVGSEHLAQIRTCQNYGFFVDLEPKGSGLIHKKNLGKFGLKALDELEEGDYVSVEILNYSPKHKGFDLKLKDY